MPDKKILIIEPINDQQEAYFYQSLKNKGFELYFLKSKLFKSDNFNFISPNYIIKTETLSSNECYSLITKYQRDNGFVFDGIFTNWEGAIKLTYALQQIFNLPVLCNKDIDCIRHKGKMREKACNSLMWQPEYFILSHDDEIQIPSSLNFPLIVKPAELSSGIAVAKVNNKEELKKAINYARNASFIETFSLANRYLDINDDVIIEEYIKPDFEISAECIVAKGSLKLINIFEKMPGIQNHFLEYGNITPCPRIYGELYERLLVELDSIVKSFELNSCVFHIDLIVKNNNFYFIELAARMASHPLPLLTLISVGYDLFEQAAQIACGIAPAFGNENRKAVYAADYKFNTLKDKLLVAQDEAKEKIERIKDIEGVCYVGLHGKVEQTVYGDLIVKGSTYNEALSCIKMAQMIINK